MIPHQDAAQDTAGGRELTGRKVLAIFAGGFGLIIGVNLFMAYNAISTFPGLEAASSYADSQNYNVRRAAQEALGWTASVAVAGETLTLTLVDDAGVPVAPAELTALLTRPASRTGEQRLVLTRQNGAFVAPVLVSGGRWSLRLTGTARNGTAYRHTITFTLAD
ncbi:MAG: FixH family protein [Rhodobacteraceae bacterium]|nr:FixH family protein [Paracoccaceae bacterium]